ncbi:non-ribosomal peptide synthetase [Streptomyces anulatus]|uniref:non-ribosomal peptide synthetase n=1 Tax=Streptomyces anulatus TaxID=1892 RepID=UPI0036992E18
MRSRFTTEQRALLDRLLEREGLGGAPAGVRRWTGDRQHAPLSFGQERLHYVERLRPGSSAYQVCGALRIRGELRVEFVEEAIAVLLARHEVLRTGFVDGPDGVEQVVHPSGSFTIELPVCELPEDRVRARMTELSRTGFNLTRPPLLRAELVRVRDAAAEWALLLCVHHIVVDGWSLGLLVAELGEVYRALSSGDRPRLPELAVQYVDFAVWQREQLSGDTLAEHLRFWRDELADLPTGGLPLDRPRPVERSYSGDAVPITVEPAVMRALRGIADDSRATLFMVLVSTLSVVLGRWSGERDIVIGTPMAGRGRAELEPVVGFFVNTVPLRIRCAEHESFRTLVRRVREVCTRAYAYQDLPFERIVQELAPDRHGSGQSTLAHHWIALHNTPPLRFDAPGLTAELEPSLVGAVRCDLSFQLIPDRSGGLAGWLEFSTELFDRDSAERIVDALHAVLSAAASSPDRPVADLPVLPPASRRELLAHYSNAGSTASTSPGLVFQFEKQVDRTPNAPAVLGTGERLTYWELDERANQVAHLLRSMGIGLEDRVGVFLPPGGDLLATVLGVLKVGAVYLPLDPGYPPGRLSRLVDIGAPRLILTTSTLRTHLDTAHPVRDVPKTVPGQPTYRPAPVTIDPGNAAFLLFTSGSTGLPKGVLGTHGGLVNRLHGMARAFQVDAGDRVLQKAPLGFDVSLWELLLPVLTGAAMVPVGLDGHRDANHLHELIDREGVTICHFVPSMLREFLAESEGAHDSVRLLLSGGEELTAELAAAAIRRLPGARLVNQYGPTETTVDVAATQVTAPVSARVPIGGMVPGVQGYVLDELSRPQPMGIPGELFVGGAQLARGYFGQPGLTAERFVPHPFRPGERLYATGDQVRWLPGGVLEFRGRLDEQVKIRGNRVEPGEVEAGLSAHPGVERAVVVVDGRSAEETRLLGYYSGAARVPELLEFLRERVPEHMVPARLIEVDRWPLGAHGKVDRSALAPPDADAPDTRPAYVAPATPLQQAVADVFAELLQCDHVGIHDSFLDLGGHSLLAIRAIARIRAKLQVNLRVGQFFESPDVASIAELIERQQRAGEVSPGTASIPRADRRRLAP